PHFCRQRNARGSGGGAAQSYVLVGLPIKTHMNVGVVRQRPAPAVTKTAAFPRSGVSRAVVCILLSSRRMPLRPDARTCRTTRPFDPPPFDGCAVVLITALLGPAQPHAQQAVLTPHIRPESRDARRFVEEAMEKSATIRELIDRLEESDVIAYVRF